MSDKKCSYDEVLEKVVEVCGTKFQDPDAELTPEDEKCIELVGSIFAKSLPEVRDDLTDRAQEMVRLWREDDEIRYGNLDEYGNDKTT